MESPRYKTTLPLSVIHGMPCNAGTEVKYFGWPKPVLALKPLNDAAEKIVDYYRRHASDPFLPPTIREPRTNTIYLPGCSIDNRVRQPPIDYRDLPNAPRYSISRYALDGLRTGEWAKVKPSDKVIVLSWPERRFCIEPANLFAEKAHSYYEANEKNPALLPSPYCEFRQALFLPDLPPIRVIFRTPREERRGREYGWP